MTVRTGIGYDVHPLVEGRPLVLGGVTIPFERGPLGHSDGDALAHSIIDALFGAAAMGDIGSHFPSEDERYRGISSTVLLKETVALLKEAGWRVSNVDATILAEQPMLRPYVQAMRASLAACMETDIGAVSVKATTTDGLGFIGRGDGIASMAVAVIEWVD
ncbi:MAG: 2-C-methyl-D-erythritol 2,4-cyclodiphosphate synthase [Chloroflexi bacterium]|nr:2-C-methyl-D-erythritol 2,4-cyclodiphosphate synthase [Chloroflexota bacterium]MCH9011323.1 2-C-methyl-D-erythritol 2,4-cyclodiphosphate synthase [Chloroflexota bacterium]